jgi:hypothetical protein
MHDLYDPAYLRLEAGIFSKYLLGDVMPPKLKTRYTDIIRASVLSVEGKDYKILQLAIRRPSFISLLDAGCAIVRPQTELRRRLYVCFTILEATPEYAKLFLPQQRSPGYILKIVGSTLRAITKALAGMILLLFI